jgi:3-oxoacid CoA-transferase subunit A
MEIGRLLLDLEQWKCDLVLSHTCPIIYEPTDLFLSCIDQSMVDKTMERYLGEIEYKLDYRAWCWGHYHQHREYPSPDGRRRLMLMHEVVRLEDVMESKDIIKTI